jgi:sulfate permease, SulP family
MAYSTTFLVRLEHRQLRVGHRLIAQGAASEELLFVESGQLSARLTLENGREIRLRTIGPGAVVGEMGLYLRMERSASVVTDALSSVYSLSAATLHSLQREAPRTAAAFHQFVAGLLAERLKHANDTLRVLLD